MYDTDMLLDTSHYGMRSIMRTVFRRGERWEASIEKKKSYCKIESRHGYHCAGLALRGIDRLYSRKYLAIRGERRVALCDVARAHVGTASRMDTSC